MARIVVRLSVSFESQLFIGLYLCLSSCRFPMLLWFSWKALLVHWPVPSFPVSIVYHIKKRNAIGKLLKLHNKILYIAENLCKIFVLCLYKSEIIWYNKYVVLLFSATNVKRARSARRGSFFIDQKWDGIQQIKPSKYNTHIIYRNHT